jgi:hypothetical protein
MMRQNHFQDRVRAGKRQHRRTRAAHHAARRRWADGARMGRGAVGNGRSSMAPQKNASASKTRWLDESQEGMLTPQASGLGVSSAYASR